MKQYLLGGATVLLVAVFIYYYQTAERPRTDSSPGPSAASPAAAPTPTLKPQTNNEGAVSITVTPQRLSEENWEFAIALNTHSEELSVDLTKVTVLRDTDNQEYAPASWQGDPPGGHHRSGVLRFGPPLPASPSWQLIIRQIGGVPERRFLWTTTP